MFAGREEGQMNTFIKMCAERMNGYGERRPVQGRDTHAMGRDTTMQAIFRILAFCLVIGLVVTLSADVFAQGQTPYTPTRAGAGAGVGVEVGRGERALGREAAPAAPKPAPARKPSAAGTRVGGGGGPVSVTGGKGAFEIIKTHPIRFPRVSDEGKTILKYQGKGVDVTEFLQQMALVTGWTILVTPQVKGTVTAWLSDISASDALKVLELNGLYYEKEGNILYVMTQDEYFLREHGALVKEEISIKYANLGDIQAVFSSLLSPEGRIIADPRTGKLVIIDTKDNIKYMKEVLQSLDVELEPVTVVLKYAQAEDLLDDIEPILSERGIVQADPRTNQLLVTDIAERIEKIKGVIAKLDVDTATETFLVKYAEPDDIKGMLEQVLPETSVITVDERTRQVTLTTVRERLEEARKLVKQWDTRLRQVAIQAYIMTANVDRVRELGINWAYFGKIGDKPVVYQRGLVNLNPTSALEMSERVLIGRLPAAGQVIAGSHFAAAIDLLATDKDTEVLANPRVLVNDGETATFKSTTGEPYQEGGYGGGYAAGDQGMYRSYIVPMQIQFMDVGTKLEVTARVNDDNSIEMEISAEDSSAVLRDIQSGTGYSTTVPVKTENSVVTKVVVGNGEAIAIGGLRIDTATKDVDKIPFLGDIPVLGHLFKSTTRRTADKELLIFLRPEIVEEAVSDEEAKLEQFRQKLVDRVRQSDRLPFDLGDKQKPLIRDRETRKNKTVLPFVPRKSDKEKPLS